MDRRREEIWSGCVYRRNEQDGIQVPDGGHDLCQPSRTDQQTPQINVRRPDSTSQVGCEGLDILQTDWEEDLLQQRAGERRLEPINILVQIQSRR